MSEMRPEQFDLEWSDTHGTVTLPWGRCTMAAEPGALVLRAVADDEDGLPRIEDLVTGHLTRFSTRSPLDVIWRRESDRRRARSNGPASE